MMAKIEDGTCDNHPNKPKIASVFLLLCIYRLANAWLIRTQFDPDEYWQTLEPSYCLAFGSPQNQLRDSDVEPGYGCALTWEWTRRWTPSNDALENRMPVFLLQAMHGPIRSHVSILPTYWYYLACRRFFEWAERSSYAYLKHFVHRNATYMISKGPMFLHALTIAAPADLSLWLIALRLEKLEYKNGKSGSLAFWSLFLSMTSWFNGYALIRTYANGFETVCLALGIVLLGPELFGKSPNNDTKQHSLRAKLAFVLGGLSACVRFTALAAWIPLGLMVTIRSKDVYRTLFGLCSLYGAAGVGLGCCIDRVMYGFWAIPFLGNFHFNVVLGLGSLYGTHPFLWYIYAGIPAICGATLIPFLMEIKGLSSSVLWATNRPLDDSTKARIAILGLVIAYTTLHSVSGHKEFRFVLPMLPLITILAGSAMARGLNSNNAAIRKRLTSGAAVAIILLNFPHMFYLAVIHQRGPIAVNQYLTDTITSMMPKQQPINIHYLMGCHSAPLYSHLHIPNVHICAWHLDCSPGCRSRSDIQCESDAFLSDPLAFVVASYSSDGNSQVCDQQEGEQCCLGQQGNKDIPTFVVVMQNEALHIDRRLQELDMRRLVSIKHTIKSLALHQDSKHTCGGAASEEPICRDAYTILSLVDINFDHMFIYSSVSTLGQVEQYI